MNAVNGDKIARLLDSLEYVYHNIPGTGFTACWSFLPGNVQVGYGQSNVVDMVNFNKELGERIAQLNCSRNSEDKLWELEGYKLKTENMEV